MQPKYYLFALLTLTSLTLNACSSDQEAEGTLELTIYGEEYIEKGIPEFDDGWSLTFSKFEFKIQNVRLDVTPEKGVEVISNGQGAKTVDLTTETNEKGQVLKTINLPQDKYDISYDISDFVIQGSAKKGNVTKNFDWHIDKLVKYSRCEDKISIEKDKKSTYQITIHADHLFFDSVTSGEPKIKFDAIADADTNNDDKISTEELKEASVGSYDIGDTKAKNLLEYITYQITSLGHFQGEKHCYLKKD